MSDKQKKRAIVDEKYDEDSDDELPEIVSNASMKTNHELESKQLSSLKQKKRQAEKEKRRRIEEKYIAQKKSKRCLEEEPDNKDNVQQTDPPPASLAALIEEPDQQMNLTQSKLSKPTRKVYPSLNIMVEPLTKVKDSRASAALNFKSHRLNKAPRESIKTAVISYQKKLQVKK